MTNCSSNRFLLNDSSKIDKNYLKECIKEQVDKGKIGSKPLIVIDGKPFRYNIELKNKPLEIKRSNILDWYVIDSKTGTLIWQEYANDGVLLVNTNLVSQKKPKNANESDILYFIDGVKVSKKELDKIDENDIKTIQVIQPNDRICLFNGDKLDGVILIIMKK